MYPVYNNRKPIGLKLLTRLRLGLSHVNEHRFNHNFENCVNPLCIYLYSLEVEQPPIFSCIAITIILSDLHCLLMSFEKLI